jgi:hypothetical protein
MRIEGSASREVGQARRPPERGEATPPVQAADGTASSSHTVSPELKALRDAVGSLPDVRPDVVAEVSSRLRSGSLNTRESATRTAEALLAAASRPE